MKRYLRGKVRVGTPFRSVAVLVGTFTAASCAPAPRPERETLTTFWSSPRADTFPVATHGGFGQASYELYRLIRKEGDVLTSPADGTAPLEIYWSAARQDYFATATDDGRRDAAAADYVFVRTEGYVFTSKQPGTIPLKLYWHEKREDTYALASDEAEKVAKKDGYEFVRVEGWIYPPAPVDMFSIGDG